MARSRQKQQVEVRQVGGQGPGGGSGGEGIGCIQCWKGSGCGVSAGDFKSFGVSGAMFRV